MKCSHFRTETAVRGKGPEEETLYIRNNMEEEEEEEEEDHNEKGPLSSRQRRCMRMKM